MRKSKSTAIIPEVLDDKDEEYQEAVNEPAKNIDGGKSNFPKIVDNEIQKHVDEINKLVGNSLYQTAIKVGNYVLKNFFNDDYQEAMSRNPYKTSSYRKLQSHSDLKIHYNTLNQMVRVAGQEGFILKELGKDNVKLLNYSHRVELLKYDDETKISFARKCIEEKLSIRVLRKQLKGTEEGRDSYSILPFNSTLTKILNDYSGKQVSSDTFNKLSLKKIQQMKSHIEAFLDRIDIAKERLNEIKLHLDPVFEEKKKNEPL